MALSRIQWIHTYTNSIIMYMNIRCWRIQAEYNFLQSIATLKLSLFTLASYFIQEMPKAFLNQQNVYSISNTKFASRLTWKWRCPHETNWNWFQICFSPQNFNDKWWQAMAFVTKNILQSPWQTDIKYFGWKKLMTIIQALHWFCTHFCSVPSRAVSTTVKKYFAKLEMLTFSK